MNAPVFFSIGLLVLGVLLARAIRASRHGRRDHLPGNFDFDRYKSREIAQRGVFDKTKWH
jgi:hypothetical protein